MSNAVPTANGHELIKHTKSVYGTINTVEAELIRYMKRILRFLQPEGQRPEQEKDVWDIAMLDIPINENPIYKTEKLDFRRIFQDGIREEVKQAIYLHLKYEKLGTVKLEMSSLRQFSKYLRDKHSGIQSCAEIDRALLEEYLIHKATNGGTGRDSPLPGAVFLLILSVIWLVRLHPPWCLLLASSSLAWRACRY